MENSGRSRCCGEKDGMNSDELLFLPCWWSFVVRADEGLSVRKNERSLYVDWFFEVFSIS
jgi:hypothetical protein